MVSVVSQVAAQELGISLDKVHIAETATDKVPNTSPSAASASSDLYCMAVIDACSQLRERLAPFRKPQTSTARDDSRKGNDQKDGGKRQEVPSFAEAVQAAYMAMVDLSARGFHAITHITGAPFTPPLFLHPPPPPPPPLSFHHSLHPRMLPAVRTPPPPPPPPRASFSDIPRTAHNQMGPMTSLMTRG